MNSAAKWFGIGALVGGGVALVVALFIAALLIGPFIVWVAWNVLGLGASMGLPELGFWAIVLVTLFLVVGWFGKTLITAIVFLIDPAWLSGAALVRWPEPDLANFVAISLLAILAGRPHARGHGSAKKPKKRRDESGDEPWHTIGDEVRGAIRTAIDEERRGHEPV
ncbi:MAG: hypothetical protein KDC36_10280 [Thermoleophilia bacterium]|nr:hypothetical protein [Thermoleophilia bacterium]